MRHCKNADCHGCVSPVSRTRSTTSAARSADDRSCHRRLCMAVALSCNAYGLYGVLLPCTSTTLQPADSGSPCKLKARVPATSSTAA